MGIMDSQVLDLLKEDLNKLKHIVVLDNATEVLERDAIQVTSPIEVAWDLNNLLSKGLVFKFKDKVYIIAGISEYMGTVSIRCEELSTSTNLATLAGRIEYSVNAAINESRQTIETLIKIGRFRLIDDKLGINIFTASNKNSIELVENIYHIIKSNYHGDGFSTASDNAQVFGGIEHAEQKFHNNLIALRKLYTGSSGVIKLPVKEGDTAVAELSMPEKVRVPHMKYVVIPHLEIVQGELDSADCLKLEVKYIPVETQDEYDIVITNLLSRLHEICARLSEEGESNGSSAQGESDTLSQITEIFNRLPNSIKNSGDIKLILDTMRSTMEYYSYQK